MTVNNTVIIDHLNGDYGKEYVGSIYLNSNQKYPISVDYIEEIGGASIRLCWWSKNQIKEIIPQKQLYALSPTNVEQTNINQELSIYPNPSKDFLNISSENRLFSASIYSCTGEKLNSFFPLDNEIKLSTVNLPNGLYIIEAVTKTERIVKKILIQH